MIFFFFKSNLGAGWVRNLTKSCYQSPGGNEGASWWVRTRNAHIAHKGKGEKEPSFQLHLHGTVCAPERRGEKKKKELCAVLDLPSSIRKTKKKKGR